MTWRSFPVVSFFSRLVAEAHTAAEHVSGQARVRLLVKTPSTSIDTTISPEAAEAYAAALCQAAELARRDA